MKKIVCLFAILFGVLCLSGCSAANNPFSSIINDVLGDMFPGGSHEEAESHKSTEDDSAEISTDENIEEIIDRFIASRANSSDVAVTVVDNISGKVYNSGSVNSRFTAWGFYLPIYIAMSDQYPDAADIEKIMSSDPGTCNNAANNAITRFGGLTDISDYLADNYEAKITGYGRLFGAPSTNGDNYTSSREAAVFLEELNQRGEFNKLSYNPENFGIATNSDMSLYAQIGTENNSVQDNLNLFGIMKGDKSDYCIVILTQNGSSANNFISDLLEVIHEEMENR